MPGAETLKAAKHPMLILGRGALARTDGAAILGLARKLAEACGHGARGLERLQRAAHRGGAGRRRSISASCPGRAARDVAGILAGCEQGEIEAVYLLGADEIDMKRLGRGLRHLSGPSRRCRRPSRRCGAARRRLYRKGRHLRQHRGPRAAGPPRRLPAGRRARGLGDLARACRRRWARSCLMTAWARCAGRMVEANPVFAAP